MISHTHKKSLTNHDGQRWQSAKQDGRSDLKWFADMEKQQGNHELKLFNIEQKTSYEVSILFGFGTDSEDSSSWVIRYNRYGESLAIEFAIFYTADIEV